MKLVIRTIVLSLAHIASVALGGASARAAGEPEPLWAYGFLTPPAPGEKAAPQGNPVHGVGPNEHAAELTKPLQAPGSKMTYTRVQVRDGSNVVDWFPEDHGRMPDVVRHGSPNLGDAARGCASCHLPTGRGRPENAPVSGQPVAYFMRQIQDFRNGLRSTIDPRKPNTPTMIMLAKAMTDEELKAAAEYFAAIPWTPWTRVVETELVPKTRISGNLFLPISKEKTEPIAGRIIEMPEDEEQAEFLRNPRSGFIAYVPIGSLKRGESLVTTGGMSVVGGKIVPGKTLACATCHGPDLKGLAEMPGIAGRSPSYLVRQMYDMQQGSRKGAMSALMQPVVANLTGDDLVAIAAYVTSLASPK